MTETQNDNQAQDAVDGRTPPAAAGSALYRYESAGITEREGRVPIWLWLVAASLLIWGVYYLVSYWSAPGAA